MDRFLNDDVYCAQLAARLNTGDGYAEEENKKDQNQKEAEGRGLLVQVPIDELAFDLRNLNNPLSEVGD